MAATKTKDVAVNTRWTDDELAQVSWDNVAKMLDARGVTAEEVGLYGTGFSTCDKAALIGVDLVVISATFHVSDKYLDSDGAPASYVVVHAITAKNDKVVFADGGVGIRDQLRRVISARETAGIANPSEGLLVRGGLVASEYVNENGAGLTYYLNGA